LIDESFDLLSFAIWKSLSRRLSLSVSISFPSERFHSQTESVSCPYSTTTSDNLNGIISYLTRKHNCHVLDSNVISITASSINSPQSYPLRHVADFENRTSFHTQHTPDSWICYDFKDMRVSLTHYSIRTRRDSNVAHLRSWILEGSIDFPKERFHSLIDSISCQFSKTNSEGLDGIISYLTRKHSCHVLDSNVISITASSVGDAQKTPLRHVADFENQTYFFTQNTPNSWICYDFKTMRVTLTHYSIRSRRDSNGYHLRSWILEGSIDCESWVELDHHANDSSMNSQGAIATFPISSSSDYQYIRLRQIGVNSNRNHCLIVNAIEFYGTLTILKQ
jgi:hypothetical protein